MFVFHSGFYMDFAVYGLEGFVVLIIVGLVNSLRKESLLPSFGENKILLSKGYTI